ncbi:hypothetical protein, partial [Streptomyces sp. SID3343]|uniref:hypothetical protein n=1 Tax=Streptomyces sp. SID3343 TaxID=2690260 RepID=UPI001F2EE0CE
MNPDDGPLNRRDGHAYDPEHHAGLNGNGPGYVVTSDSAAAVVSAQTSASEPASEPASVPASVGTPGVMPGDRPGPDTAAVPGVPLRTPPRLI